jgi:H+/gluconate symporter-like permease
MRTTGGQARLCARPEGNAPMIAVLIALAALALLITAAYRGYSVILFAPIAALLAVLATDPALVAPLFSGLFMEKLAAFLKNYFPVFLLGAVFGKLFEISGFSDGLVSGVLKLMGPRRAIPAVVAVCALLTYGGVSLFVVVFAAYPFAAAMFRRADIPKRLLPATIVLGGATFTMDSLPGTPQIQNIIPTGFFGTTAWAAPVLGVIGAVFILSIGLLYLERARRQALAKGEGYGAEHLNEPEPAQGEQVVVHPVLALLPLLVVALTNLALTYALPHLYPASIVVDLPSLPHPLVTPRDTLVAIWAVEGALVAGILTVIGLAFARVFRAFAAQTKTAISGALLASLNTASEYGFGAVIAVLPGFLLIRDSLQAVPDPLVNEAVSITTLSAVTGSASGGMSIALGALGDRFIASAQAAGIPPEVLHRVASMASGGMDTLPHNGAIITILAVTGLTHRQAYKDIFALTLVKTAAVFVVIAAYYMTGWV